MKKAKIILTVLTILGIVGGALAYKATRMLKIFYIDTTTTTAGGGIISVCTVQTLYPYTLNPGGVRTIKASTASINMTCPVISVTMFG